MKNKKALFTSSSDHWATPNDFIKKIEFDTDICPLYCKTDNLLVTWGNKGIIYCNPPYSNIKNFINKIIEECKKGVRVKLLIPARTDTIYFHKLINSNLVSKIYFLKGRLKFNEKGSAPFPSVFIDIEKNKKMIVKFINYKEIEKL